MAKYQDGGEINEIMATTDDLVVKLGQQLVDLINKDKIIGAISKSNKSLGEARIALSGEVETLKGQITSHDAQVEKLTSELNKYSRKVGELRESHTNSYGELKDRHRDQLGAATQALRQVKDDHAKLDKTHADELQNMDAKLQKMNEKLMVYQLEIQSLKDKQLPSNGASRVVSSKPKKQGKKYTKKAAKTTASA